MIVYLGIGSNIGDRLKNLEEAVSLLNEKMEVLDKSKIYEAEPIGHKEQEDFLNMAIKADTLFSVEDLLKAAKSIEAKMGRKYSFRNGPRVIDIDILLYGKETVITPDLTVPHKSLKERLFAIKPLLDLNYDLKLPNGIKIKDIEITGQKIEEFNG